MERVGIRELRQNLRRYLQRVDSGERFEVTEFGRPIAELVPLSSPTTSRVARLIAEGRLSPARGDLATLPPPVRARGGASATEALLTERRSDPR
jgi:prevent-host-death family protein